MKKLFRVYQVAALMLLNTIVLLVFLNLLLGIAFFAMRSLKSRPANQSPAAASLFLKDGAPIQNGKRTQYHLDWFDYGACSEVPPEYMGEVLDDFTAIAAQGFLYQPWVQFCEQPYQGKRVTVGVDSMGFPLRRTVNPEATKAAGAIQIYCFGGSTTFGYHVSDQQTWPTFLSEILNERAKAAGMATGVVVSNYGRGFYNSSQETSLLLDLLKSGHRPALVIFMDGFNESVFVGRFNKGGGIDIPHFSVEVGRAFAKAQTSDPLEGRPVRLPAGLPMVMLVDFLKDRLRPSQPLANPVDSADSYKVKLDFETLVRRYQENRKISAALCREYGVSVLHVLQSAADDNYPVDLYRRPVPQNFIDQKESKKMFYKLFREQTGVLNLGDLFAKWGHRKAIVDDCHYNPGFNRFLAQAVAAKVDLKSLAAASDSIRAELSSGRSRAEMNAEILNPPATKRP